MHTGLERNLLLGLLAISSFYNTSCMTKSASHLMNPFQPNSSSDPVYFENQFFKTAGIPFEKRLDKLPTLGGISEAWSDTFLPNRWGGAGVRWYGDNDLGDMDEPKPRPDMWNYKLHTPNDLRQMSEEMIRKLSPSEKYDILLSRYDYPLTNSERERNKPGDADWEGVCNGWSTAAIKYSEPNPVTIVNKEGISIPFGASDIKSLLMLHQYFITQFPHYAILGDKCNSKSLVTALSLSNPAALSGDSLDSCSDANAGSFHLVVSNMLGRLKKGLVFDVDRDDEVWNQPVFKFETRILERSGAKARVSTDVWYAEEKMPSWDPMIKAQSNNIKKATYNYNLELAPDGTIIGGSWIDGSDRDGNNAIVYHPDFIWYGDGEDENYMLTSWKSPSRSFTLPLPIEMGAVIDIWKVSTGKSPNFRGQNKKLTN